MVQRVSADTAAFMNMRLAEDLQLPELLPKIAEHFLLPLLMLAAGLM